MKKSQTNRNPIARFDASKNGTVPDCLAKIEAYMRSLNAAEKKAAKYILKKPGDVIDMTISELATESSVSESTVFKLCRTLDFNGFRDFKITLARQYGESNSYSIDDEPVKKRDSAESLTQKSFHASIDSLQSSLKTLDYGELERAYKALKDAKRVLVISVGMSRTTSLFAADKFALFGIDAVAATDIHVQAMRASLLTPKDVLFAFSRSGDTRDIIEAVKIAKDKGATIIGVTNSLRSYFAKLLDIQLLVQSKISRFKGDVLASRIEHICLVDVIYLMFAARNPKKAAAHCGNILHAAATKQL
ncbi:MAG: MurR/RpiR family transcriptional regulator [Deltaproteobacteria bacterium]|nr:MurR/RpiR family transcriptional regulator [Deltaproteobacteria bacterium]